MTEEQINKAELSADEQVRRIVAAAQKLGVEVDETDATQWLTAVAATQAGPGDFAVDAKTGIFGHRITLLDFDPEVLVRYRWMADIVQLPDRPGRRDGHLAVGQRRPVQGAAFSGRRRLFRAGQHPRADARGGVPHPGRRDARQGPGHLQG